jgi:hypothetical protein
MYNANANRTRNFTKVDPRTVTPSRHVLFIRNLPVSVGVDRIRAYFAKESDSDCQVEFVSVTEDRRCMSIAIRFESHSIAKDILAKFNNKRVFDNVVFITWFKDLKRARDERMNIPTSSRGGGSTAGQTITRTFTNNRREVSDRSINTKRGQNVSYDGHSRHATSRSRQYSDDEQNGGAKGRGSSRSKSRTRSNSRYSNDAPRAYRSESDSDEGARNNEDDASLSAGSERIGSPANASGRGKTPPKMAKRRPKYSSKRSSSSENSIGHRKENKNESMNSSAKRPRRDEFSPERDADSQSGPYYKSIASFGVPHASGDGAYRLSQFSEKQDSPAPSDHFQNDDQIHSSKTKGSSNSRSNDTPQDKIKKRKLEIEQTYKKDCETFTTVTKLLISKDRELEERLLTNLKEVLNELGQQCIQDLRLYINKVINKGVNES